MSVILTNTNDAIPIHISVTFGHLEETKTLIERGTVVSNTNKYGNTPMMVAT